MWAAHRSLCIQSSTKGPLGMMPTVVNEQCCKCSFPAPCFPVSPAPPPVPYQNCWLGSTASWAYQDLQPVPSPPQLQRPGCGPGCKTEPTRSRIFVPATPWGRPDFPGRVGWLRLQPELGRRTRNRYCLSPVLSMSKEAATQWFPACWAGVGACHLSRRSSSKCNAALQLA